MKRLAPISDFSRNVLTLMLGTTVAQAIPIAISPLLTRIYSPEEFGVFALFISISSIFAAVANGRYELAIMLPEKDEDAINIAALGLGICFILSTAVLVIVFLFNDTIAHSLGSPNLAPWLYMIPFSVFFMGLYNALSYYSVRHKKYRDVSNTNIIKATILASLQIGIGALKSGAAGLIIGYVVSHIAGNLKLLRNVINNNKDFHKNISVAGIAIIARRYADFPKYSVWSALANSLSHNLGSILISKFYMLGALGQYSLVQRVLASPINLIGGSVGQVFYQEASDEMRTTGTAIYSFEKTFWRLMAISIPIFTLIYFSIEDVFSFVFGEEWRIGGNYARILVPLFAIRFIVSPLSFINQIYLKNNIGMYLNIVLLTSQAVTISVCGYYEIPVETMFAFMTVIMSSAYLFFLWVIYRLAKSIPMSPKGAL